MLNDGWQKIQDESRVFIIAEAGVNHNGSLTMAKQLVDVAAETGADAVKFQAFKGEELAADFAGKAAYQEDLAHPRETQKDMLERLELSKLDFQQLFEYCRLKGVIFLASPFDHENADMLDSLGMSMFKISSGELTNIPFLRYVAGKKKPMILSTGMATLEEVREAWDAIQHINKSLALLHCVSCYPAEVSEVNLRAIKTLRENFPCPVGFSDHTLGSLVSFAAVGMGASIIEKHITLAQNLPGPDHRMSMAPAQFKSFVQGIREIEQALGTGQKVPVLREKEIALAVRRSIVAARDIPAGSILQDGDLLLKRPGTGLPPGQWPDLTGKTSKMFIAKDSLITREMVS